MNFGWIAILFIAGNLARSAPDAPGHIEVKAILLSHFQCAAGYEFPIASWNPIGRSRRLKQIEDRFSGIDFGVGCQAHKAASICGEGAFVEW